MALVVAGIGFGESPRWHDGQIWFSDWAVGQVGRVGAGGEVDVVVRVASFPLCFDFLPDGRMLLVDSARRQLLRRELDGTLITHADLAPFSDKPWNDIVVAADGTAYVNNIGYDFPGGQPGPGLIVRVSLDGDTSQVAGDLAFPNGMALSANGTTLIVAESHRNRLTAFDVGEHGELGPARIWATTGDDHPDGICIDADDAVWYADVASRHCVRVREGGEVLDVVETERGAFACVLDRDPQTPHLYVIGQEYGPPTSAAPTGELTTFPAPAPGAGRP